MLWDLDTGQRLFDVFSGSQHHSLNATFSGDSTLVAIISDRTDNVLIEETATGQMLRILTTKGITTSRIAFHPDWESHILAVAGRDATTRLWDAMTGQEISRLEGHERSIVAIAFNHDGHILATADYGGNIYFWSV